MQKKNTPTPAADTNPWIDTVSDIPLEATTEPVAQALKPGVLNITDGMFLAEYDMEGLMNDFPTATELERFVYDQTGQVLNLKGRANKLKYQIAMDCLNGAPVAAKYIGTDNPYVDRTELVPTEDLRDPPPRDPTLPDRSQLQNSFVCRFIPHSDPDYRAQDRKVDCVFRKYRNGMISFEVPGPLDTRPEGEKQDKFGRMRPEIIRWVDPRTGEQVAQRRDGTLTPMGRNLRALMQKMRVNHSNQWAIWVDREFGSVESGELNNPWLVDGVEE